MKSDAADPPCETREIATPLDDTGELYRVYFEEGECREIAFDTFYACFVKVE